MKSQFVNKVVNNLKDTVKDHESDIRCDFKFRNQIPWNGYGEPHSSEEYKIAERAIIRKWIKDLREAREVLNGIKKQMPMPVKVTIVDVKVYKFNVEFGVILPGILRITKSCQCQKCSNGVYQEVTIGYRLDKGVRPKYCPCCGQKLWWPK